MPAVTKREAGATGTRSECPTKSQPPGTSASANISAEDRVERRPHRPGRMQVQLVKADQSLGRGDQPKLPARALEEAFAQACVHARHHLGIIGGATALFHDQRVDIGRQDPQVMARGVRHQLQHRHRHRPGFLPVRTAGRPQPHPPASPRLGHKRRQDLVAQGFKVMRLAEEMRDICGQRRDHPPPLVAPGLAFDQREIAVIVGQIERAQAFCQPRLHHAGLAGRDHDPGLGMGDAGDRGHLRAIGKAGAAGMGGDAAHAASV